MENNEFKNMNEFNGTGDNINKNRTGLEEIFSDSQTKQVQQETVQTVASEQEEKQNVYSQPTYHSPSYGSTAPIQPYNAAQNQQQVLNYQQPYTANAYGQNYSSANGPQNANVHYTAGAQPKPKKKSAAKKVALIAGALALTLCVGVGGGLLGASLAGSNPTEVSTTSTSSESSKNENSESALNITQASDSETTPTTTQEVAAKVRDSVVEITTEITTYDSYYGQYVSQAAGSGAIISEDGYIITNNHVIEDANTITVRLTNSKTYTAKLIGKDATLDVALLKIDETGLTAATFGDSSKLSVGQTAIAIGNPLGQLGGTVTDGIISALDREIELEGKTMNLLQTNAAINPGNSGGGLFDSNGNLIGIVVAKSSSTTSGTSVEGLGFAIPANDVVDILEDLKTKGYVSGRGSLGVNIVSINTENAMFMYRVDKEGVYVTAVTSGSAAEKAGIKVGDCITKFEDKEITEATDLTSQLSKHKAGEKVKLTIYRDGKEQEIEVTLDEKAADDNNSGSGRHNYFNDDDFYGSDDIFGNS